MTDRRATICVSFAVIFGLSCLTATADVPNQIDFDAHVKPILSDRCFKCHGPDDNTREADLRLDSKAAVLAVLDDAEGTFVVKPGSPEKSIAYQRITSRDPDVQMPPPDSKLKLSRDEIETIRKWIEQGAEWKNHWSFEPRRDVAVPKVENEKWPTNEIDRFILSKIESARRDWPQLKPNSMAAKETLLRRVTFDLTGLPPTLAELDEFLADKSDNAYERAVDRLLASDRYGEHLTAGWLDAARYSDTYGYQVDRDRHVWPWRDWVVRAFNDNMSYDRFITEQIAGDLLPGATDDQILATAFNRLHPQKVEGGSVPEEFRTEYVADRAQTFATAFLGLTMECCRCHDHKYDPITQREYYQLFAFFNTIDEAGLYSYFTPSVPTPTLRLSDQSVRGQLQQLKQKVADAEKKRASISASATEVEAWIAEMAQKKDSAELIPGRVAHLDFENQGGPNRKVPGKVGSAVELTGDDGIGVGVGNFKRFEPFSVAFWMSTPDIKTRAVVFHRSRAWTDAGSRGYQLLIEDGRLSASLIHFWPGNAIRVRTSQPVATGEWLHVGMTYDGSGKAAGLQIYVNGSQPPTDIVRDNLYKNITGGGGDNITIGERFRDLGFKNGQVDEFSVYNRRLNRVEVAHLHSGESLKPSTLKNRAGELAKQAEYRDWHLAIGNDAFKKAHEELKLARQAVAAHQDKLTEIMVMREMVLPRTTRLLKRGAYDAPGEEVVADTPAALTPFPSSGPRNRLGLAKWLTDPKHPLTARVAVNQFWQLCFGDGLVRTPEDFGTQGARPTHPELLDWLANDFVNNGWDVKRLLKQIVMSSTYRQSSRFTNELLTRDPENRLLARAPRYRLSAEMLRDNTLAVAGLLKNQIGGPPARPYEVEVSFKPAKRDSGDGLYRRSLYTFWKRTAPAPVMMSLDASKREVCRVKRERTSSPLQAFVLMNGPQFVEAARMLSQRLLKQHGEQTDAALTELFRTLTSRLPHGDEVAVLRRLFDHQLQLFGEEPKRADEYLKIGDAKSDTSIPPIRLAAFSVVASTVMNYDESVIKR